MQTSSIGQSGGQIGEPVIRSKTEVIDQPEKRTRDHVEICKSQSQLRKLGIFSPGN